MGVKVTNNAYGTISAGISSSDTTITLDSGQGARFPTLGAGDYFYGTLVDTSNTTEIVKVTARSTDSMTVVRGQDNTTASAFAIGDRFELRPTAALFEDIGLKSGGTVTGDVVFNDNVQARFGTGGDLNIYHNGSHSFIDDAGTGNIRIRGNDGVYIQKYTGEPMVYAVADGAVTLYYDNSQKLATVSDGVEINGNIRRSANADFRFKEMPSAGASSSGWHTVTDLGIPSSGVWEVTACPRLRFGSNQGFILGAIYTTSNSQITETRMLEERLTVNGFGNLSPAVTWILDLGTDQTYTYDIRFRLYYQSSDAYGMNYNDGNGRPYLMARKIRETTSTGVSEIRTY